MATLTTGDLGFPNGTVVSLYPANSRSPSGGAPSGAALTTATVTAGALTFTHASVVDDVPYIAYAGGRYVQVRKSVHVAATQWRAKVKARRIAIGTTLPGAP